VQAGPDAGLGAVSQPTRQAVPPEQLAARGLQAGLQVTALAHQIRAVMAKRGDEPTEAAWTQPGERDCPEGVRRRDHTSRDKIVSSLSRLTTA
jgi:hypothetical protein